MGFPPLEHLKLMVIFIIIFKTFQSSFLFFFPFRILLWSLSEELRISVLHSGPFLGFNPVMGSITFINAEKGIGEVSGGMCIPIQPAWKLRVSLVNPRTHFFLIVSVVRICAVFSSETSSSLPSRHDNDGDEEKNNHHPHPWYKNTHKTSEWTNTLWVEDTLTVNCCACGHLNS